MKRLLAIGLFAALPFALLHTPAGAQPSCGAQTVVAEGETLPDVAERCDVTLAAIFDANPDLRTTEPPVGTEIRMPAATSEDGILERTGRLLRDAGREIEDAATRAGKSVSDYLSDNPDLNRDILEWGEWMGLPGVAPEPVAGADVSLSPESGRPGDEITVTAVGLHGDTDVAIGLGAPGSGYEIVERTRTDSAGRLEAAIEIPPSAADQDALVFVVETDRLRLISQPFEITSQ